MRNIKLVIEYDGSPFHGWQIQKGHRTVQGELERAIAAVVQHRVKLIGSGRTDTGVHALGQVASFKTTSRIPPEKLVAAINANVPREIAAQSAEDAPADFHARFSAKWKTYRYVIWNSPVRRPLLLKRVWFVGCKLNAAAMRRAAAHLVGEHNFSAFESKSAKEGSVRHVRRLSVSRRGPQITVEVESNGFLYNMVRAIVGTLVEVGRGRLQPTDIRDILQSGERDRGGPTSPPDGLTLMSVTYE